MKERLKTNVLGALMLAAGAAAMAYQIANASEDSGFMGLYLGMQLVTTGLGLLGVNTGRMI